MSPASNLVKTRRHWTLRPLAVSIASTLFIAACGGGDGGAPIVQDPAPTDPAPTDPVPTDPVPTDPVPTDDPTTSEACYNWDLLFNEGSSWGIRGPTGGTTIGKILGSGEFDSRINILVKERVSPGTGFREISYFDLEGIDEVLYGQDIYNFGDLVETIIFNPPRKRRLILNIDEPYVNIYNENDSQLTLIQTYAGRENINVASGDFEACKLVFEYFDNNDNMIQKLTTWRPIEGKYQGLGVVEEIESPGGYAVRYEYTDLQIDVK